MLFSSLLVFYCCGGGFEYQVIIVFFLILSIDQLLNPKYVQRWSLGLGIFAGIALLTKFNIGFFTTVSLLIWLLAAFFQSTATEARKSYLVSLITALAAIGSTAYIFLNPNPLVGLAKVFLCFLFASGIHFATRLRSSSIHRLTTEISLFAQCNLRKFFGRNVDELKLAQIGEKINQYRFLITYCLGLLLLILFVPPFLLDYLRGCLEISSGYSAAMSLIGDSQQLAIGLSGLALVLVLLVCRVVSGDIGFALASLVLLLIIFKHGFVRQPFAFFTMLPFLVAVQVSRIRAVLLKRVTYFIYFYAVILALIFANFLPNPAANLPLLSRRLSPSVGISKIALLSNLERYQANLKSKSATNLAQRQLPAELRQIIGNKLIDIVPRELVLIPANNLNWQPRPTLQSYVAYTAFLDELNFQDLSQTPRNYFLYSFITIDGRHPFFDEPKSFFYIFCNYKPSLQLPASIPVGSQAPPFTVTLLEKQPASRCSASPLDRTISLSWQTRYTLPETEPIVRAAIQFKMTLFGKLYRTLFRAGPIRMRVTYENGSVETYRVLPDNAPNGILVSNLPVHENDAIAFFAGNLRSRVSAFSFSTNNPLLYQDTLEIKLIFDQVADVTTQAQAPITLSQFESVQFLPRSTSDIAGNIERVRVKKRAEQKGLIEVSGWAIRKGVTDDTWILITVGTQNKPLGIFKTNLQRPDISPAFKAQRSFNSDWSATLDGTAIAPGKQHLKAWVYDPATRTAMPIDQQDFKML